MAEIRHNIRQVGSSPSAAVGETRLVLKKNRFKDFTFMPALLIGHYLAE